MLTYAYAGSAWWHMDLDPMHAAETLLADVTQKPKPIATAAMSNGGTPYIEDLR